MTGSAVRAGSPTVARLSDALNVRILRTVTGNLDPSVEAEDDPTTELIASMAVPEPDSRYVVTPAGEARLPVANALEHWLLRAPGGPLAYADPRAERAIAALAGSWGDALLHALASEPRPLEELIEQFGLSERLLKRALDAGLVEAVTTAEGGVAHAPTEWARHGLAPLILAARAERAHPDPGDRPIDALDVEAALLLTVPLASVPSELSGSCRLVVSLGEFAEPGEAGATATIERGRVVECVPGIELEVDATASGDIRHWFRALIDDRPKRLTYDGDRRLARNLVKDLGETLFGGS